MTAVVRALTHEICRYFSLAFMLPIPYLSHMNAPTFPAPTGTIHLQYVGQHHAVRVSEIVPGCVLVWNTGALTEVVAVAKLSPKFVNVVQRSFTMDRAGNVTSDSHFHSRRMKLDRLAGYSPKATSLINA